MPYAPLNDLLRMARPPSGGDFGDVALSDLVGAVGRAADGIQVESGGAVRDQHRLFATLADWFAALASHGPLLLAIEDLHWSDTATMAFLPVLARRLIGLPALIAVTMRAEDSSLALRLAMTELNRQRLVAQIDVDRLSREGVGLIVRTSFELAHPVHDDFLDTLYTLTDGNPFFVKC